VIDARRRCAASLRAGFALLALLALAAGCRMPRDTAAVVDGRAVPAAVLEEEVRSLTAGFNPADPALARELPRIRRAVLERLIDRELMLEEAERRGLRPDTGEVERALAAAGGRLPGGELEAALSRAGTDRERWRRAAEQDLIVARLQEQLGAAVPGDGREAAFRAWLAAARRSAAIRYNRSLVPE